MARIRQLTWQEVNVPELAEFLIYSSKDDVAGARWVKKAWRKLREANRLRYITPEERCHVAASILSLAYIYRGFVALATGDVFLHEIHDPEYDELGGPIGLIPPVLAKIPLIAQEYKEKAWRNVAEEFGSKFLTALANDMDHVTASVLAHVEEEIVGAYGAVLVRLEKARRPVVLATLMPDPKAQDGLFQKLCQGQGYHFEERAYEWLDWAVYD
jgi:hypothetical protein